MGRGSTAAVQHHLEALFNAGTVVGLTDEQLLERYARGRDGEAGRLAFEAILQRHGPMVLGVCRRVLGEYHETEDAFQATFLVLAIRARSIRKRQSLGPWLHGVALRISRRARAARDRSGRNVAQIGDPAAPEVDTISQIDLRAGLDAELSRLPPKYRLPLVLCYLEGRTQEEAARELGWTKGTVSGRLARAKDLLRTRLDRRGLAPSLVMTASGPLLDALAPAVPASLVAMTLRAAWAIARGRASAACVPGSVLALIEHARWARLFGRIRATAVVLSMAATLAAAASGVIGDHGKPTTSEAGPSTGPPGAATAQGGSPPSGSRPAPVAETRFFSIVDRAGSFAYVIDRSGSMATRDAIGVVRREVWESVRKLDSEASYCVVFYNLRATVLSDARGRPGLMAATEANKDRTRVQLETLAADGGTDHMLGLRTGLAERPQVVFFLTDADLLTNEDATQLIAEAGKTRIHVIEFRKGAGEGSPALRRLAAGTGGRFRVIDISTLPKT